MALSDMQVFNEFYQPAIYETLAQNVNAFNEASNGGIQLVTAGNVGDVLLNSFYSALQSSKRRVDRYSAIGTVSPTAMTATEHVAIKLAGGFGPISWEPSQMTWLRKPTAEAIEIISRQFAEAMLQDQLNAAITAAVAAITSEGANTVHEDNTAFGQVGINASHALFGDMSPSLVCTIMNGAAYHKLIAANLANAEQLFVAQNVTVVDILGKRVIVTDSSSLSSTINSPAVASYKALSLVQGGVLVRDPSDPIINIDTRNGGGRIATTFQADYDFTIDVKGYSFDKTVVSPTDAELADSANWSLDFSSVKHGAGVINHQKVV